MVSYWTAWFRAKVKLNEESGQGLVEYALIIVIIAIALIAVLTIAPRFMGGGISTPTPTP